MSEYDISWEVEDHFAIMLHINNIYYSLLVVVSPPLSGTEPAWSLPVTEISPSIHHRRRMAPGQGITPPPSPAYPFFPHSAHQKKKNTDLSFLPISLSNEWELGKLGVVVLHYSTTLLRLSSGNPRHLPPARNQTKTEPESMLSNRSFYLPQKHWETRT